MPDRTSGSISLRSPPPCSWTFCRRGLAPGSACPGPSSLHRPLVLVGRAWRNPSALMSFFFAQPGATAAAAPAPRRSRASRVLVRFTSASPRSSSLRLRSPGNRIGPVRPGRRTACSVNPVASSRLPVARRSTRTRSAPGPRPRKRGVHRRPASHHSGPRQIARAGLDRPGNRIPSRPRAPVGASRAARISSVRPSSNQTR